MLPTTAVESAEMLQEICDTSTTLHQTGQKLRECDMMSTMSVVRHGDASPLVMAAQESLLKHHRSFTAKDAANSNKW